MEQITESIFSSCKDLIKFKIIGYINTGDKTQDNIIIAIFLSIITLAFTIFPIKTITNYYYFRKYRIAGDFCQINNQTIKYYREYANNNFLYSISIADNILLAKMLCYGFDTLNINSNAYMEYNSDNKIVPISGYKLEYVKDMYKPKILHPIYSDSFGIVFAYKEDYTHIIKYNCETVFNNFIKVIEKCDEKNIFTISNGFKILNQHNVFLSTIYPDRNFDMFISKHKNTILNAIENFELANSNVSCLGGYGNYNLGFILYGSPGTGKTFLIKALANRLKRDVIKVDMRQVKTVQHFEALFKDNTKIYCLDEFDCVQGVIRNRTDALEKLEHISSYEEIKELKAKHLELLKIVCTEKDGTYIKTEIQKIEKQINDLENSLSLETILTTLDGIHEMRGRVIVATTNFLDRIDSALLRPGRFDMKINLDKFDCQEIRELLFNMYKSNIDNNKLNEKLKKQNFRENHFTPTEIINIASLKKDLDLVIKELI